VNDSIKPIGTVMKKVPPKKPAAGKPPIKKPAAETTEQYRKRICEIVFACMAEGHSLRKVCRDVEIVPSISTMLDWFNEDKNLAEQYARARATMADVRFEEFREAADTIVRRYLAEGWEPKDAINMARLECGNMQWELSKLNARKYGDKVENTVMGPDGGSIAINVMFKKSDGN
jgi:hypothetical protein